MMLMLLIFSLLRIVESTNTNQSSAQPSRIPSIQPTKVPTIDPTCQPSLKQTSQPQKYPSSQPTRHPINHPSGQPYFRPSNQPLRKPTYQPSKQPRRTPTRAPSNQPTKQPRTKPIMSPSSQPTRQPAAKPRRRPSEQPTRQPSVQPRRLPSMQPHTTPTSKPSMPSCDPTRLPTSQPFRIPRSKPSLQPKRQPSSQPFIYPSSRPTLQPAFYPRSRPSQQPIHTPTRQPNNFPSAQPSKNPQRVPTSQPQKTPSRQPNSQPSQIPLCQPTYQPKAVPSVQPQSLPSLQPSNRPLEAPTLQPQTKPTSQPLTKPISSPTSYPSAQPSALPSDQPLVKPTLQPTEKPSQGPSGQPSARPSTQPASLPTQIPTHNPSSQPRQVPTSNPSEQPTSLPSIQPNGKPTTLPSHQPTNSPTLRPTCQPSRQPIVAPSGQPRSEPSSEPSSPSAQPSTQPSTCPSHDPSRQPTVQPTSKPSPIALCPKGMYYNLTGYSYPGIPTVTGYYKCFECRPGWYNDKVNQPRCKICPKGSFSYQNSSECTLCAQNTYAENNGTSVCTSCGMGEFNGLVGSFSALECVNPLINFVVGIVAFFLSLFGIIVYIWFGRLHKIAFERKFRLIRKCIIMYGAALTTSDMITQSGSVLDALMDAEASITIWKKIYKRIIEPLIIYPFLCLFLLPVVTVISILQSAAHIVFNAMVLWRAYNSVYIAKISFVVDCLTPFLYEFGKIIHSQEFVNTVSYPLIYLMDIFSNFTINLSAIKVTCTGSQSPLYLLCDVFIVGIVIIIIESDVNVFWTMLSPMVSKLRSMVFSQHYFFRAWITLGYLGAAILITQLPDPSKIIQYSMGFVVIKKFFNLSGNVPHIDFVNLSPNCDATTFFPIDSTLAYLSGILALIALPPVVYMVSVVLFAHTQQEENNSFFPSPSKLFNTSASNSDLQLNSSSGSLSPTRSHLSFTLFSASRQSIILSTPNPQLEHQSSSHSLHSTPDFSNQPAADVETNDRLRLDSVRGILGSDLEEDDNSVLEEKKSTKEEEIDWASPAARGGLQSLHTTRKEGRAYNMKQLSICLRLVSSFFAADWFMFKIIFNIGKSVFKKQRAFLTRKFMIHTSLREYDQRMDRYDPTKIRSTVKVFVDAFDYDDELKTLRKYAQKAKLRGLPWFDGLVVADNEAIVDRIDEDKEWAEVKRTLPNFSEMIEEVRTEMAENKCLEKLPWSYTYLCYLIPAQLCTESGWKNWMRVLQTYFGMFLVCFGIWPQSVVKDFKIIDRFKKFVELQKVVYSSIGDEVFQDTQSTDVFTKIDNDEKVAFGKFLGSMCTCRIALLQVAPVLTAWSLFASAVASSPLFVSCPEMREMLPPLILPNPFEKARELLTADYRRAPPRHKVWFLGYYILINQSRLIQYFLNAYFFLMSASMIFFPQALVQLVPILVAILLHQGIISSWYVILLLQKLLFNNRGRHEPEEGGEGSPENLPIALQGDNGSDNRQLNLDLQSDNRSNDSSFIDDNCNKNQSRAKGFLWLESSSSDLYSAHNISISGDNDEASAAPTPARRVKELRI